MGANSKIEWTDHTVNFVIGCEKVSEACAHCYAESLDARYKWGGQTNWGKDASRYLRIDKAMAECLRLNRKARLDGRNDRVFVNSLSDTFESREDLDQARHDLFGTIEQCKNLTFLLLTKRPENITRMAPEHWRGGWPDNVIPMTTVENQKSADLRIPHLLKVPAKRRGLSCEPLLGPVDLGVATPCGYYCEQPTHESDGRHIDHQFFVPGIQGGIHWVIAGSESGFKRRTMETAWALSLKDQCAAAGVSFFMKQMEIEGKVSTDVSRFPVELQRREFPI